MLLEYICFYLFLLIKLQIFDVNLKSAFLLAKDVIPLMEKRGFEITSLYYN